MAASLKNRLLRSIARLGGPATRPLAGRRLFPLWAVVYHAGRRSGRTYATPIAIQLTPDGFVIPLPFGDSTQWARNVLAAGGCRLRWRGAELDACAPEVVGWAEASAFYGPVLRALAPALGIRHFLRVRRTGEDDTS